MLEKYAENGYMNDSIIYEKNLKLYEELKCKFLTGIFSKRPNPIGEMLKKDEEKFRKLMLEEQCKILIEILKLTAIGTNSANLKAMGEAEHAGVMLIPKKIDSATECYLIHQSVTGVYEKYINLLTV